MSKQFILEGIDYGRPLNDFIPNCQNFQYWEFVSSETAIKNNIANIPTEEEWQNIEFLCQTILQPLRDKLGFSIKISSAFRRKLLNDLVGSNDKSYHRLGLAADLDSNELKTLMIILETLVEMDIYTEIIAEYFPNGWVHVGFDQFSSTKKIKIKDKNHNYKVVSLKYIKELYGTGN